MTLDDPKRKLGIVESVVPGILVRVATDPSVAKDCGPVIQLFEAKTEYLMACPTAVKVQPSILEVDELAVIHVARHEAEPDAGHLFGRIRLKYLERLLTPWRHCDAARFALCLCPSVLHPRSSCLCFS